MQKELLTQTFNLVALRVPNALCSTFRDNLTGYLFTRPKLKCIIEDKDNPAKKLLILDDSIHKDLSQLPEKVRSFVQSHDVEIVEHEMRLDHTHMSVDQILQKLLPAGVEIPTSFETIGHIAHLNLRDQLWPYKNIIGEVIIEKNPKIKTVVNKTGKIETQFRTFPMEVIAGENSFETSVKESNCNFHFNFAEVYWNSRLQHEHERIVALFKPKEVICDMFAGIGPFAIPAAKKGCSVYANDLNPKSFEYLEKNAKSNKVTRNIQCFNKDARDFIRELLQKPSAPALNHIVMNLPASAVEFLDVFRDIPLPSNPTIHCYGFSSDPNPKTDILNQIGAVLGAPPLSPQVYEVRDVSPHKLMMCVSFKAPPVVVSEPVEKRKLEEGEGDEVENANKIQRTTSSAPK